MGLLRAGGGAAYQPQQSVLNRHAGQRQTACIRYISAPQRSQTVRSSSARAGAHRERRQHRRNRRQRRRVGHAPRL